MLSCSSISVFVFSPRSASLKGHMVSTVSFSQRLGGLYCLYCLYDTEPFKPPFKIYISMEAREMVDVESVKHIADDNNLMGDIVVAKIAYNWNVQREIFYQQTGLNQQPVEAEEKQLHQRLQYDEEGGEDEFVQNLSSC